jgi:hypothetical protein
VVALSDSRLTPSVLLMFIASGKFLFQRLFRVSMTRQLGVSVYLVVLASS